MYYFKLKSDSKKSRFLVQKTDYSLNSQPNLSNKDYVRTLSEFGSDSYKRSLRRAFARAKALAFFNPDLLYFITFTYKENVLNYSHAMKDIKLFLKKERRDSNSIREDKIKYIYVFERQKRGAIHVHMIANTPFTTQTNANGYLSLINWSHGFTSILSIADFDANFRPYLYLLKYMNKAQRVGRSFIHTSRSFDKIEDLDYARYIHKLKEENLVYTEDLEFYVDTKLNRINKSYYKT